MRFFYIAITCLALFVQAKQNGVELDRVPTIQFGEIVRFHANQTWLHVKSEQLQMSIKNDQCVEARLRIEGKRTRLRAYTCTLIEGGECRMGQYKSAHSAEFCHQFYPWHYHSVPYSLQVIFERRPRRFQDKETELRVRRRRIGRQATREVASFYFVEMKSCSEVCQEAEYTTMHPMKNGSGGAKFKRI